MSLAILSAVLLPANLLTSQRFHHDEALYATWALQITSGIDPWLAHTPIDKPPLFLYLVAGAMGLLGATETAARVPSLLATALTVGLTFWLGRKLYGTGVAVVAAWLVVLSPFTILFVPPPSPIPVGCPGLAACRLYGSSSRLGRSDDAIGYRYQATGTIFVPIVVALLVIYDLRFTIAHRHQCAPSLGTHHVSRFIPLPSLSSPLHLVLPARKLPIFNPQPD
jgi:hypothetical protein